MNRDQFSGKWHELKGKVREKWGKLTDDDVSQVHGKWEQLCGKLQQKYGWSKEQAEKEMNRWCSSCEDREESRYEDQEFGKNRESLWNERDESEEKRHPGKTQESWNQRGEEKRHSGRDQNRDKKRKAG